MEGFIYIISETNYYKELKKNKVYKHIPDFIFNKIDRKLAGNIVSEFKIGDNTLGYGSGVTIREDTCEEEIIKRIEDLLRTKLSIEKINCIIFEKEYNLSIVNELIRKNILVPTNISKYIKVQTIPGILKDMIDNIEDFSEDVELLIIPESEKDIYSIIYKLPTNVRFISMYMDSHVQSMDISNEIMNKTGMSIEVIKDISKFSRFDLIINFKNDIRFGKWVKQKSIIFNIYNNISTDSRRGIYISDLVFKNPNIINSTNKEVSLKKEIPSILYSFHENISINDFSRLRVGKNLYNIEEFCKKFSIKSSKITAK